MKNAVTQGMRKRQKVSAGTVYREAGCGNRDRHGGKNEQTRI